MTRVGADIADAGEGEGALRVSVTRPLTSDIVTGVLLLATRSLVVLAGGQVLGQAGEVGAEGDLRHSHT